MSTLDAAVVSYLLSQRPEQASVLPEESDQILIAPHEYVLVYCPQEPHHLSRHALAQRLHDWFPDGAFDIAFPEQENGAPALAVLHADGHLMLQALMLSGVQVDFDLAHLSQFGFAPVLTRQLDVLRMLRQLSETLAQPDWQKRLQSALSGYCEFAQAGF